MKKLTTTIILCVLCASVWGQSTTVNMPQILAPSPKASMINRFHDHPTNLYTGLVDITVPIYTIQAKGISIPIEFKYHASGIKFDDLPMELGMGWTLVAGGTVSYAARGTCEAQRPMGNYRGFFTKDENDIDPSALGSESSDHAYLRDIVRGANPGTGPVESFADGEYDIYTYSFPGHSGQFFFPDGPAVFIPAEPLKVLTGNNVKIWDENGIEYVFTLMDNDGDRRNMTYYLTRVVTANKSDTVVFNYTKYGPDPRYAVRRPVVDGKLSFIEKIPQSIFTYQSGERINSGGLTTKSYYPPTLNSIEFSGGKVEFTYEYVRSLQKITIYDSSNQIIKSINLTKTNHRWLDKVSFSDGLQQEVYKYEFSYNGEVSSGLGIDYWGYYNGKPIGTSSPYLPNFTISTSYYGRYTISGMDKEANESEMKKGMLTKIVYPTGGYSIFDYEAHKSENRTIGGLRIKEIRSYNSNNELQEKKWYKYGMGETGNGRLVNPVHPYDFCTTFYTIEIYNDNYVDDVISYLIRNTTYTAHSKRNYFTSGSPVVYSQITEYTGDGMDGNGKTVYQYYDFHDEFNATRRGELCDHPTRSYSWKTGVLRSKQQYDKTNRLVYSLSNYCEEINTAEYRNLRVLPYYDITGSQAEYIKMVYNRPGYDRFSSLIGGSIYDYYNYYLTTGLFVPERTVEWIDGVSKTTYYQYNELGQVIEQKVVESDGSELATRYKYVNELRNTTSSTHPDYSLYRKMVEKNIVAPLIEQEEYKGNTLLFKTAYRYKDWGNNLIALQYVQQTMAPTTPLQNRIIYYSYDSYGNPKTISKDGLEDVTYIWGYKGQYPLVEIRGGGYSDVHNALGESFLTELTKKQSPTTADMNRFENLRNNPAFASLCMTTFYYKPSFGLSRVVAPNGTQTSYEYDNFGRLLRIKDHNGKIMEEYKYQYKQ